MMKSVEKNEVPKEFLEGIEKWNSKLGI